MLLSTLTGSGKNRRISLSGRSLPRFEVKMKMCAGARQRLLDK